MPYETDQPDIAPSDELPQALSHKPIYALPYEAFDVLFRPETDMRYFSVGIAQYNAEEVSLKIWRHSGKRWTRQSEEIPLHRLTDALTFVAKALFDAEDGNVRFPPGTFDGQEETLTVSREDRTYGELATYNHFLDEQGEVLKERLRTLRDVLNELTDQEKL